MLFRQFDKRVTYDRVLGPDVFPEHRVAQDCRKERPEA